MDSFSRASAKASELIERLEPAVPWNDVAWPAGQVGKPVSKSDAGGRHEPRSERETTRMYVSERVNGRFSVIYEPNGPVWVWLAARGLLVLVWRLAVFAFMLARIGVSAILWLLTRLEEEPEAVP